MLPKIATTYLDIYCRTAGMSRQAVLSWLLCVAAAKLAEGVPRELDDFLKIVDTFLLNFTHPITSAADARPPSSDRNCRLPTRPCADRRACGFGLRTASTVRPYGHTCRKRQARRRWPFRALLWRGQRDQAGRARQPTSGTARENQEMRE